MANPRSRSRSLSLIALPLLAAAAPTQARAWTRLQESPGGLSGIFYDTAHQRAVGFESLPASTWSFDGTRWRRHSPDGLDVFTVLNATYDRAHGQGVLLAQTYSPWTPCRTYVGSGAGWRLAASGPFSSAPDSGATFAFDPARSQVISFGGTDANLGMEVDTMRSWNGASWVVLHPAVRPSPRTGSGMVLDPVRNQVVLFGGCDAMAQSFLGDTWEWNGVSWTQRYPSNSPSPRTTVLGHDPATQQVVALGGYANVASYQDCWGWDGTNWAPRGSLPVTGIQGCYDDGAHLYAVEGIGRTNVWCCNGSTWAVVFAAQGPNGLGAAAFDPTRGEVLLAGGAAGAGTQRWNGQWQTVPVAGPGPRRYSAMAPLGSDMVLCGGWDANWGPIFDTWAWNGTGWTMRIPAQQPAARYGHAIANHGNRLLLFGGDGGQVFGDTWTYDGVQWSQLTPLHAPAPRWGHGLAHDPVRGRTVLFGGQANQAGFFDTWEWDGVDWQQAAPTIVPLGVGSCLAWDPQRSRVVLPQTASVLAWDGVDWTEDSPSFPSLAPDFVISAAFDLARQRLFVVDQTGLSSIYGATPAQAEVTAQTCGTRPDLRLFGLPSIGRTPEVHVEGAANTLAILAYGFASTVVHHAPACDQLITVDAVFAGVTDARGELSVPFAIPAVLGFRGITLYSQAVVLDGGPVYGASLSGAVEMRIGD